MSIIYLQHLFRPRSIAVVGATNRPQSVGSVIMRNLQAGGFEGPIMPVNPRQEAVAGVLAYPDVFSLPRTPDLAVLCTPPESNPDLIDELGVRGTRAALVIGSMDDAQYTRALTAAKRHDLRFLGGRSLGIQVPPFRLNASFSHVKALPGHIGFVSQSDAVGTLVLDWAYPRRIGFSHFVSLGDAPDIDFGDMLDYLGSDPGTRAILLYIEDLRERKTFMAAARAAARNKPVLAIKAGRRPPGSGTAGFAELSPDVLSLVDPYDVFDAALQRAGILRVRSIDELFGAVETLARARPMRGEQLVTVSNGGGTGTMAADELYTGGLNLATLSDKTASRLKALLGAEWNGANPIDIRVDATSARYADVLKILGEDEDVDAILAMHTPTTLTSSTEAAMAVIRTVRQHGANVLTCWIGGDTVATDRKLFVDAGVPTFDTPSDAVRAFLHMVNYRHRQESLMQMPPSIPVEFRPDPDTARRVVQAALAQGQTYLNEPQVKEVLAAYGIPVVETHIAEDPAHAKRLAKSIGFPVAMTVLSPDIHRKWDVGGVALGLETADAVESAARGMRARVAEKRPDARVTGFSVQRMVPRGNARQLFVGAATDPLFGPIILFGEGGRAAELFRDLAVGLPPLNVPLAQELVARTRVATLLKAHLSRPAANLDAVCLTLMQVSQLIADVPELVEMDINPLFADERGVTVVDARMKVAPAKADPNRLAIHPYPKWLEETILLRDGRPVLLRPIRPEDEPAHHVFISKLTPEDIRFRFFHYKAALPHSEMARLTQIDYDREMAFIAIARDAHGEPETLGVIRSVTDPDNRHAEFSMVTRSDLKGQGLGRRMMRKMIDHCRSRGTLEFIGDVLAENKPMLSFLDHFGFMVSDSGEEGILRVSYRLN